jgi:hypothetical protein
MYGRTYTQRRRARDVWRAAERARDQATRTEDQSPRTESG